MAASPRTPDCIPAQASEGDENAGRVLRTESLKLEELRESRAELQARVQSLKKDLQEWRGKLDNQVKNYRQELGDLKNTLNMEVEQLQSEFQDLRMSIRKQLDATTNLSTLMQEKLVSPSHSVRPDTAKTAMMTSPKKTLISLDGLPSSPNQTMGAKFSSPLPKALCEANTETD